MHGCCGSEPIAHTHRSIEARAADYLQVSEWREGRVVSLDTAEQSITVEPWGADAKSRHQNGQVSPYQATAAAQNCLIRQP